jgi:hypothetical protein
MRLAHVSARRSAFTLLEVLLAAAIGVMLLGALYVAMDLQLSHARAGREKVEASTLARSLFERMSTEISLSLGPVALKTTSSSSPSNSAASATSTSGATGTAANSSSTSASTSTTPTTTSTATTSTSTVTFNQGLQGDNGQLTVYLSRWPREAMVPSSDPNSANLPVVSDLRRVTWWMSDKGLARQEIRIATSDDALNALAPDLNDTFSKVVAGEVKSLTFQYWDGTTWQDSWDGTQPGADGTSPMGPPQAISIVMDIAMPNTEEGGELPTKRYRHVVVLQTANGLQTSASGAINLNPNIQTSTGGTQP